MRLAELAARAKRTIQNVMGRGSEPIAQHRGLIPPPIQPPPAPHPPLPSHPPLPQIPVHPRAREFDELTDLAQKAQMGQLKGVDATNALNRMLQIVRGLEGVPMPSDQIRAVNAIKNTLELWETATAQTTKEETTEEPWPEEDEIELLGRADVIQWPKPLRRDAETMRRTPGSSNVYAFTWIEDDTSFQQSFKQQNPQGGTVGTLIVTFKDWKPGSKARLDSPGATYAYSNVPNTKWQLFKAATSPDSAGIAVWDFLRLRGTVSGHQHPYRLLSVTGEYIPRKATAQGFAQRMMMGGRDSDVAWRRSTLPPGPLSRFGVEVPAETGFTFSQARSLAPSLNQSAERRRGEPNRGRPNNGRR